MTRSPRAVDTPEKAAAYARSLARSAQVLENVLGGRPALGEAPLADYFDDLPGQDEILHRLANLRDRIDEFQATRPKGSVHE